jgi:Family of unknown function (DUF5677)
MNDDDFPQMFKQLLQTNKEKNFVKIKKKMRKVLAKERKKRAKFEKRLYLRWKKALDLFEAVFLLGRDSGAEFNQQVRPFAVKENDLVFEVLTRIHAHACFIMSATLTLLKSGHAGDALARARTLHELDVTAQFIQKGGNELADKFLLYQVVESLKAAKLYDQYYAQLGYEPLDPETIPNLEHQVNKYRAKFGEQFSQKVAKGSYGWASEALNKKQPTFEDLEAAVGLSHMRPHYKLASEAVHASVKGILFDIGDLGTLRFILAGPINAGLADPGSMALTSFHRCTTLLLCYTRYAAELALLETYAKSIVASQIMQELLKEANQAFLEAHQQLVRDELELQAKEEK